MAKSPVYGRGRNRKHGGKRQKNVRIHAAAANINMKGKKSKPDHCWCCVCIDMRDDIIKKIHKKEIKDALVAQPVEAAASKAAYV